MEDSMILRRSNTERIWILNLKEKENPLPSSHPHPFLPVFSPKVDPRGRLLRGVVGLCQRAAATVQGEPVHAFRWPIRGGRGVVDRGQPRA